MLALSSAVRLMVPPAVTEALSMNTSTSLLTSFLTTMPPTPLESEPVTFRPEKESMAFSRILRFHLQVLA